MNLKAGRSFELKHSSFEAAVELFNALNVAPGTSVNFINGTGTKAFGYTSVYMAPMIGRLGLTYKF
jgi:hypothetical protein